MGKLTKGDIDRLKADGAEAVLWDGETRGFGVRALPSGTKSFILKYRNKNGRSRQLNLGRYGPLTVQQARDLAIQNLGDIVNGIDPADIRHKDRNAVTVKMLCAEYLEEVRKGTVLTRFERPKKASTLVTDRGRIERHIKPLLGHRVVKDLKSADIKKFIRDVQIGKTAADVKTGHRGRAIVEGGKGTATRTAGLLSGILTYAVDIGVIERNPVHGIRKPAYEKRKRRLKPEEFAALGKALRDAEGEEAWQVVAIVKTLALTGARLSEIVAFKRTELDADGHAMRLGDSKSGESIRPLGKPALEIFKAAAARHNGPFLFPAIRKSNGHYGGDAVKRITKRAGLTGVTAHTLRHSFTSEANDLGYTRATRAALIGHSSGNLTDDGYTHHLDAVLIAAADAVAGKIAGMMDTTRVDREGRDDE